MAKPVGRGMVLSPRAVVAEHKALLRKHLRLYADAGGKYITTYAVHSPWCGQFVHDRRVDD